MNISKFKPSSDIEVLRIRGALTTNCISIPHLYKAELGLKTLFLPTKSIWAKKGKHQMLALLIF